MRLESTKPSVELSKLVNEYLSFKNTVNSSVFDSCELPDSSVRIVFNLSKNRSILRTTDNLYLPDFIIVPAEYKNFRIDIQSFTELFVISCKPTIFYSIFRLIPEEFKNKTFFSSDIFDGYPMHKTLKELVQTRERISFFENFILNNTPLRSYRNNSIDLQFNILTEIEKDFQMTENYSSVKWNFYAL